MTKKNTTKRALFASVLSLLLCVSMLIGSTFAWFTDNASTGVNTIQSGNLDIVLSYKNATQKTWKEVSEADKLFNDAALWEPGYTEVAYLKLENNGSLALKYQLTVNVLNEVAGKNKDGEAIKLSEVLKYDLIELTDDTTYADRAAALAAVSDAKNLATEIVSGNMEADADAKYFALVVYMPTTVGNEANHNGTDKPSIQLGVNVLATQYDSESDSFGKDYDENAPFIPEDAEIINIGTAEELVAFAASNNTSADAYVMLTADIDMTGVAYTSISNFAGTFDGQGYAISNLSERLFYTINGTVKNLKVANVNVAYTAGTDGGSGIARYMSGTVENCEFSNIVVSTTARGKRMGGIFAEVTGKITGCTVNGVSVIAQDNNSGDAYIDSGSGAFVGIVRGGAEITDCTLNNVVITADKAFTVGGLFGKAGQENQASITLKNITVNGLKMTVGNTTQTYATIGNIGGFIGQCDYRTNDSRLIIDNCHINNLDMTLVSNAAQEDPSAGFISSLNGGADITNCSVDGTINGTNEPIGIGGFLGTVGGYNAKNAYVINITDCVADVAITGSDNIFVGGFVAHAGSYKQTKTITLNFNNCEAKGSFYGAMDTNEAEVSVFTGCKVDGAAFNG